MIGGANQGQIRVLCGLAAMPGPVGGHVLRSIQNKPRPARCKPSSVPSRPRGAGVRRRRPFIWTVRCRTALARRQSGLPAIMGPNHADRCLALHPVGFAVPDDSRRPRCALTAPFHPYPGTNPRRYLFCGTIPYAAANDPAGGRYPPPWFSGARTFLPPSRESGLPRADHWILYAIGAAPARVSRR